MKIFIGVIVSLLLFSGFLWLTFLHYLRFKETCNQWLDK